MKTIRMTAICFMGLLMSFHAAWAQGNDKSARRIIPVRVTVVFKEFQQSKLVDNLPYILLVGTDPERGGRSHLRMGLSVPIRLGMAQFDYHHVGTNIDCSVSTLDDGKYEVHVTATRDSVRPTGGAAEHDSEQASEHANSAREPNSRGGALRLNPIFSDSSIDETLLMRDGQTIQSLMATDPVTGRVLKVDVTLNVVK